VNNHPENALPVIVLGERDYASLIGLALDQSSEVAHELLSEVERARVVPESALSPDTVRMGSRVLYGADDGTERWVTLVYPAKADIAEGKISVMTPVGAALIGLSKGQSISWTARDGRQHRLTVLSVEPPEIVANVTVLRTASTSPEGDPGPQAA
jgi:regulator of nucleoside diphosphate kinase